MMSGALLGWARPSRLPSSPDAASGGHVRGGALSGAPLKHLAREGAESRGDIGADGRISHVDDRGGVDRSVGGPFVGACGGAVLSSKWGVADPLAAGGGSGGVAQGVVRSLFATISRNPTFSVPGNRADMGAT